MNTGKMHSLHAVSGAEQTTINTTSWVGHFPGINREISKGQTFTAIKEGDLEGIEVLPTLVTQPGEVSMSVHEYDVINKKWGKVLCSTKVQVKKSDCGKWMRFSIPNLHLSKGQSYGFKLASHDCFIGVAEAVGSANNPPFPSGGEWRFHENGQADSFSYISLAFKVSLRA